MKKRTMIRQSLVMVLLAQHFLAGAATGKNPANDIIHYDIRLEVLDFTSKNISGETTLTFRASGQAINELTLELRQLLVDSIFHNGQPILSYNQQNDQLIVTLPSPVQIDDTASVTIFYHGVPYSESWGGFHFSGQYAFNLGVGFETYPPNLGKAWFPCVDDFFDRALFDIRIRVTDNKKAICGGLLQSVTPHNDGTHTFHWKSDFTLPTYLASFAIGDYVAVTDTFSGMERDVPITIYVRPADEWKVAGTFLNLHQIMANLENRFGPYPFERIGYTGTALGAMEHAGNIAYPQTLINNSLNYEWLYAHEIAHMWFGNKVTCAGPGEMWLNEGWAVWNELLYREDLYGSEIALAEQRVKHRDVLQYLHTPQGDGAYYALYNIPPAYVYGKTVYQKGGLVAQTLRNYLGDDLFFPAVQFYLDTFAYHYASTHDLRDVLSQHSGVDLTGFFDSWVFEPGFPHYSIDSFHVVAGETEVFVRQRGKGRDYIGEACIVEITFMDQNRQVFSDTMFFNGQIGSKVFQTPFQPVIAMMDYYEKICDASTDRAKLIAEPGSISFEDTFSSLLVNSVDEPAFIRITHNWVAPDPLKTPQTGLRLSDYRHWHVDGIIPAGFDAGISFSYQRAGFLDDNLIVSSADSLVILYRASTADDWSGIPFERYGAWHAGQIRLDTLRLGEYTLAVWDAEFVGIDSPAKKPDNRVHCFPNPGKGKITITWHLPSAKRMQISDINGVIVAEYKLRDYQDTAVWETGKLVPGLYFIRLFTHDNIAAETTRFILTERK
jgi:hypothetical protein